MFKKNIFPDTYTSLKTWMILKETKILEIAHVAG